MATTKAGPSFEEQYPTTGVSALADALIAAAEQAQQDEHDDEAGAE
ncbi:MAG: hypothetical protein FWF90_15660 [Promicromonosporaceae bacterium]|nr:hypothetical protein [Promicromonosporaceae bacterium]